MLIIDRIEDGVAVIETDCGNIEIAAELLPDDARAGSVLEKTEDGYRVLRDETEARRRKMSERTRALFGE